MIESEKLGTIHFGQKGSSIRPGTKKGDSYCSRSAAIKDSGKYSPNQLSRKMWGCKGKKSYKRLAKKVGSTI